MWTPTCKPRNKIKIKNGLIYQEKMRDNICEIYIKKRERNITEKYNQTKKMLLTLPSHLSRSNVTQYTNKKNDLSYALLFLESVLNLDKKKKKIHLGLSLCLKTYQPLGFSQCRNSPFRRTVVTPWPNNYCEGIRRQSIINWVNIKINKNRWLVLKAYKPFGVI